MPTFLFFKGKVKVDALTGADEKKLEEKIKQWTGGDGDSDVGVKGHVSSTRGYKGIYTYNNVDAGSCIHVLLRIHTDTHTHTPTHIALITLYITSVDIILY